MTSHPCIICSIASESCPHYCPLPIGGKFFDFLSGRGVPVSLDILASNGWNLNMKTILRSFGIHLPDKEKKFTFAMPSHKISTPTDARSWRKSQRTWLVIWRKEGEGLKKFLDYPDTGRFLCTAQSKPPVFLNGLKKFETHFKIPGNNWVQSWNPFKNLANNFKIPDEHSYSRIMKCVLRILDIFCSKTEVKVTSSKGLKLPVQKIPQKHG